MTGSLSPFACSYLCNSDNWKLIKRVAIIINSSFVAAIAVDINYNAIVVMVLSNVNLEIFLFLTY